MKKSKTLHNFIDKTKKIIIFALAGCWVVGAPNDHGLDSQSENLPRLWAQSLDRECTGDNWPMFLPPSLKSIKISSGEDLKKNDFK